MLFSSTAFIYLFLPAVLLIYYLFLRKHRLLSNVFLFGASLIFYGWGEPKFVFVMMASIVFNWLMGLGVHFSKEKHNRKRAKIFVALACVVNLGLLFVFKYLNFTENILLEIFGISPSFAKIALPIGISFFTFQALSYVIDVYRGKGEAQLNILNVGLYISFFPQLIAGPIVRYETVAREIHHRRETREDFYSGFARFVTGLSKKVLLANTFGILADRVFALSSAGSISAGLAWLGALGYTFQIYFDFGGYSDMAIGLGKMFGFHFLENFNYPYISRSVTEFWRRWHMSLGTWFRDYLYIPLGGSRVSKPRLILNLFVVWFFTGMWHGANLTFVVWGLMYFVLLVFEKLTGIDKKEGKVLNIAKWIYTMILVIIGWVIFRSDSLSNALSYIGCMFGAGRGGFADGAFWGLFGEFGIMLAVGAVCSVPVLGFIKAKLKKNIIFDLVYIICLVGLFALCISSLVSSSYNPFIYFNF